MKTDAPPKQITKVDIPEKNSGREFIPRHWVQIYTLKGDRDKFAEAYSAKIQSRGIENFVLLHFFFDYKGHRQFGFYFAQQTETLSLSVLTRSWLRDQGGKIY